MPAMAREPSGTLVLVLCGQPEQNQGWRSPVDLQHLHRALLGLHDGQARVHARGDVAGHAQLLQALGNGLGNQRGRQVGVGAQQVLARGVGHRPFAAGVAFAHVVELAQHVGAHVGAPVVQLFLELVFDDLALFLHHQDLLQAGGELARDLRLQRPHHAHLVQADAQLPAGVVVQPQVQQRLARVVVGLAAGDHAEAVVRAFDHVVVERLARM
jgi:hypothetical protein